MTAQRKPKWRFSATSTKPTTSAITSADSKEPAPPRVIYTIEAWQTIKYIVAECKQEVGWLGLVEQRGDDYWITEVFIPKQEISSVTTEIESDAVADLGVRLLDEGKDTSQLIYWGHSHVNMGVGPSGRDEAQLEEYLEHCPKFIRGIYNKKGESKVDVFDRDTGVVYQCVDDMPEFYLMPPALADRLDATMKENLVERRYLPPVYPYHGKSQSQGIPGLGYTPPTGQGNTAAPKETQQDFDAWLGSRKFNGYQDDNDIYHYIYGP